jgi:hypothetical protein
MKNLLYKEWKLCMHPAALLFLLLSAMMLIPNYPYLVCFFYTTLGIFFICLTGRENGDIRYSLLLPVKKGDLVRARILLCAGLEGVQILLAIPFCWIRQHMGLPGNQVGADANLALLGYALLLYALFNWVFFTGFYRNVDKIGVPFLKASLVVALYTVLVETLTHIVPLMRDQLDTNDPQNLAPKLCLVAACLAVYLLSLWGTMRGAGKRFERLDL